MGIEGGTVAPAIEDQKQIPILRVTVEIVEQATALAPTGLKEPLQQPGHLRGMTRPPTKAGNDETTTHGAKSLNGPRLPVRQNQIRKTPLPLVCLSKRR